MAQAAGYLEFLQRQGAGLCARLLSRDGLNLRPALLSQAAARRLRAGLRALAAFLRRVLIVLALGLEPGLKLRGAVRRPRRRRALSPVFALQFRVFVGEGAWPASGFDFARAPRRNGPVLAAPLLAQLAALGALLSDPQARARRLAFHLARERPGPLLAPQIGRACLPTRFGTELSALYHGLAAEIAEASRARPPPLGPLAWPGPRIRSL